MWLAFAYVDEWAGKDKLKYYMSDENNKINEITEEPVISDDLLNAFTDGKVVLFIWAWISMLLNWIWWSDIASELVKEATNWKKTEIEKFSLKQLNNPKKIITVCRSILWNNKYFEVLNNKLNTIKYEWKKGVIQSLLKLSEKIITTNIDKFFINEFSINKVLYWKDEIKEFDFTNESAWLLYIHWLLENEKQWKIIWKNDDIVFSAKDYINKYSNTDFIKKIEKIFQENTVLFIWYWLEELEILDFLITKIKEDTNTKKHYLLWLYFEHENYLVDYEKIYFKELNIDIIPFSKNERWYDTYFSALEYMDVKIIERREKQINKTNSTAILYNNYKIIDDSIE